MQITLTPHREELLREQIAPPGCDLPPAQLWWSFRHELCRRGPASMYARALKDLSLGNNRHRPPLKA